VVLSAFPVFFVCSRNIFRWVYIALLSVVVDEQRRIGRLTVALMLAEAVAVSLMVPPVLAAFPLPAAGATAAPPLFMMAEGATAQAAAGSHDDDDDEVAAQAAGIAAINLKPYVPPVAVGSVTAASTASALAAAWAEDKADEEQVRRVARGRAAPRWRAASAHRNMAI